MHNGIFLVLVPALLLAAPAEAASVRETAEVRGSVIRVGDLFDDAGAAAEIAAAKAPPPGRREIFDARRLMGIAQRHKLDWQPRSRYDRSVVTRVGRPIPRAEIEKQLSAALRERGLVRGDAVKVSIFDRKFKAYSATGITKPFSIENIRYDRRSRRVTAVLVVPHDAENATRTDLSGRAEAVTEVPVLTRRVRRGEIVEKRDVAWRQMPEARLRRNILMDPRSIVGQAARHNLYADKPLKQTDLEAPVVIERGALVTLTLRTPHMTLTTRGRSLENGAKGRTIRVLNIRSKRTVEGIVEGPGSIRIPDIGMLLASNGGRS